MPSPNSLKGRSLIYPLSPREREGVRVKLQAGKIDVSAIPRDVPEMSDYIFFAGAFASPTGLMSNFPVLSEKNTHSEALSQAVVWR